MTNVPITHLTLYKHGVGYFQRQGHVNGEQVELTFRVEEMNDVLKSLTAIDLGHDGVHGGRVLSINYATPQTREEQLAGSSVRLENDRSLRDLLVSLRGREVQLLLDQGESVAGRLVGIDEVAERLPLDTSLVSILIAGTDRVETMRLGRIHGIEILEDRASGDLRFFLDTALTQEDYRGVVVHLTPGDHNLAVSYVAPAPTWRVSYRLVAEQEGTDRGHALLLGWGIFDNCLEEDLENISLSLVAGMPISFLYDLYTPFTPSRPTVQEEARVAAAPVEFAEAEAPMSMGTGMTGAMMRGAMADLSPAPAPRQAKMSADALESAVQVSASGESMGELFQYRIGTPVTVERGHSAMVPILSARLEYDKDLLYNGAKLPAHPVATLRLQNRTGLTLERGPVTVVEDGDYVGEALVAFTPAGGEINVPYAVELGVEVQETDNNRREIRSIELKGAYLQFEEWHVVSRTYQLGNKREEDVVVLLEYPLPAGYDLFDTPAPAEVAGEHRRFRVAVHGRDSEKLYVQARRLTIRHQEIQRQSYEGLQKYLSQGLMDRQSYEHAVELLRIWEQIAATERRIEEIEKGRQQIYQAQQQIQGNMGALGTTGKEGALRARYVQELESAQDRLQALADQEADAQKEIEKLKARLQGKLKELDNPTT